jgi:hypothetical protein
VFADVTPDGQDNVCKGLCDDQMKLSENMYADKNFVRGKTAHVLSFQIRTTIFRRGKQHLTDTTIKTIKLRRLKYYGMYAIHSG